MAFAPPPRSLGCEPRSVALKHPTPDREDTDGDSKSQDEREDEDIDEVPFWEEEKETKSSDAALSGVRSEDKEERVEEELKHDSRLLEAPLGRRHTAPSLSLRSFPTPYTRPGTASAQSSPSFHMSPNVSGDREVKVPSDRCLPDNGDAANASQKWLQVPSFRPAAAAVTSGPERILVETLSTAMRRFRGTSMRAWRCDFDKHGVGWVSRAEFARACRFYGCPADQIWTSCHQSGGAGMKFWELDPDEALNLELFEQVLWIRTGFDLLQTWGTLDPHNQTVLTLPEFVRGCRALGFEGDAHHLFKGLDHQGLGRVSWHDFEYLQKLCDASSCAKGFTLEVRLLRSWAVEVCADLMELLRRLSLVDDSVGSWAQCAEPIPVEEFIHRLEALDYPGDPADIAAQLCKTPSTRTGAAHGLSAEHVRNALFGKQTRRADGPPRWGVKEKKVAARKKNPIRKAEWDSSIWSGYRTNVARPAALRVYFSTPAKEPRRMSRASSNPAIRSERPKERQSMRSVSPGEPRRVRPGELNHR